MAEQLTLEQSIGEILPTLPQPIRRFLQKKKIEEVAQLITDRYALHIDHGAIIEHQLRLVLLGLEGPEEFATELFAQLPISEQTVRDILGDINKEIFVPLREEMRKGTAAAPAGTQAPAKPIAPAQPKPASIQYPPLPRPAASLQGTAPKPMGTTPPRESAEPEHYFHLENKIPPLARPVAPRPPVFNPSIAPLPPKSVLPPPSQKLLRDREEPHLEIKKTAPPPPRPAVAPSGVGPSKPSFVPPNLPGVIQPPPARPIPEVRPSPAIPKVEPQIQPKPIPPPMPAKPYTTDPYREPIGGK